MDEFSTNSGEERPFERKWNKKFSSLDEKQKEVSFLPWVFPWLEGKVVLDLACGAGRNSFYLKNRSCDVLPVDGSRVGLQKLQELYGINNHCLIDLEEKSSVESLRELPAFEAVLSSFYKPSREVFLYLSSLNPELVIVLGTFSENQEGFSRRFCFDSELLEWLESHFRILIHREGECKEGRVRLCVFSPKTSSARK